MFDSGYLVQIIPADGWGFIQEYDKGEFFWIRLVCWALYADQVTEDEEVCGLWAETEGGTLVSAKSPETRYVHESAKDHVLEDLRAQAKKEGEE
jgi:hypothetical protein